MSLSLRQQEILDLARLQSRVTVDELVARFHVTAQTIRKDLNELCDAKVLSRAHGGAVITSGVANVGYEQRRTIAAQAKQSIGERCAAHIPNNASLFINIGTTTEAVARALMHHRDLLVVTNNLNVANILVQNPTCEVIIAGGVLRRTDGGIIGEATADFVNRFKLDYAIIGASAIDEDGTLLDYDDREVRVSQAIIANARHSYLVADRMKLERTAPMRIAHISQMAAFFTDEMVSTKLQQICALHTVKVVSAR